ncbi:oxygenase MpaB family protein [Bacterioplanoides sp.]|uniref:oxygenase MpaB family protein n=1 Tax=Bacterioplanoides sp. TaxID=2066072 RepID=UPI003B5C6F14
MGIFRDHKKRQQLSQTPLYENYHERVKYLANTDMPIDFLLAGELAQIQTFVIPSISRLLHRTKQYEHAGTKRLDDTRAILTECMADTVHSDRGQLMVEQLNFIHGHYQISNDDYLYTLALFMVEPVRWSETFGYRRLSEDEKQALYLEFRDLGEAMNIQQIPEDFYAVKRWYEQYRRENMAFDPANRAVTEGLIRGMQQMMPKWIQPLTSPLLRTFVLTMINDDVALQALGIKPPSKPVQGLLRGIMKLRSRLAKRINIWQIFDYESSLIYRYYKSYPGGYQVRCLGPEKIISRLPATEKAAVCPFSGSVNRQREEENEVAMNAKNEANIVG